MSKIVIASDTKTGEMSVSVNGKELKNVTEASVYMDQGGKKSYFYAGIMEKDEENEVYTRTTVYASDSEKGQEVLKNGGRKISDEFVALVENVSLASQIEDFLK